MLIKGENIYDILGIDRNADKKTIKHAYARLVKQYHPEEQPEEWKRIHDAYELAMKIASGQQRKVSVPVLPESQEQEQELHLTDVVNSPEQKEAPSTPLGMPEWKDVPGTPVGNPEQHQTPDEPTSMPELALSTPVETPNVQETDTEGLFGEIEELANMQRQEEEKAAAEKLKSAIHEVQSLAWQNEFKTKKWKQFFAQENLYPIISQKKFLRELGDCFFLKQIDKKLYTYMNEQLDVIADYIKVYSTTAAAGSMDMASVEYARSKVEVAYRSGEHEKKPLSRRRIWLTLVVLSSVLTTLFSRYMLSMDAQRQKERQALSREIMEQQVELQRQRDQEMQEQMQNSLETDSDIRDALIRQIREEMEAGTISQEYYERMLEYLGVDPDEAEE